MLHTRPSVRIASDIRLFGLNTLYPRLFVARRRSCPVTRDLRQEGLRSADFCPCHKVPRLFVARTRSWPVMRDFATAGWRYAAFLSLEGRSGSPAPEYVRSLMEAHCGVGPEHAPRLPASISEFFATCRYIVTVAVLWINLQGTSTIALLHISVDLGGMYPP